MQLYIEDLKDLDNFNSSADKDFHNFTITTFYAVIADGRRGFTKYFYDLDEAQKYYNEQVKLFKANPEEYDLTEITISSVELIPDYTAIDSTFIFNNTND